MKDLWFAGQTSGWRHHAMHVREAVKPQMKTLSQLGAHVIVRLVRRTVKSHQFDLLANPDVSV